MLEAEGKVLQYGKEYEAALEDIKQELQDALAEKTYIEGKLDELAVEHVRAS